MIHLDKIKLIIWDLDETLWNGTISESEVKLNLENIAFIQNTLDMGIVHSICSKNEYSSVKEKLIAEDFWQYFVFPSINWEPKGLRIKSIVDNMALRPVNVLFIDDNIQNLNEAQYYCPEIMTALPEDLTELYKAAQNAEKKDLTHKRLKQYKIMEEKKVKRKEYSSNAEFLMSCGIVTEICHDCVNEIDRIYELLQRSNQLNFTKIRPTKEELNNLICDPVNNCGYVKAHDKFGDYGIVGFFAVNANRLIHYAFSCRTLGMQIEQYVYMKLGCPDIDVVGDVVVNLEKKSIPPWINTNIKKSQTNKRYNSSKKVLFKGPCDMSQIFSFIRDSGTITTEFTYVGDNGSSVEGHNHTAQIVTELYADDRRKKEILSDFDWFDKNMLSTALKTDRFDFLVLSMLTDGALGVYRRKETGEMIALCPEYYDLTNPENWDKYINKLIFTAGIDFKPEDLKAFAEKYEYVSNANGDITVECLSKIYDFIGDKTQIILLLGSERPYKGEIKPYYYERHIIHRKINKKISEWAENKANVTLLPFDRYIKSDADYLDTINHFVKSVYYALAVDIISIIDNGHDVFKEKSRFCLFTETLKQYLRQVKHRIRQGE